MAEKEKELEDKRSMWKSLRLLLLFWAAYTGIILKMHFTINVTFVVAYCFVIIALLMQLPVLRLLFSKKRLGKWDFFIPYLKKIFVLYLAVQMLMSFLEMWGSEAIWPAAVLVLNSMPLVLVVLGYFVIGKMAREQ